MKTASHLGPAVWTFVVVLAGASYVLAMLGI